MSPSDHWPGVMTFDIEAALRRGVNRTIARNGLLLAGVLFVVSAVNAIVGLGVGRWVADRELIPMGFPVGPGVDAALFSVPPAVGSLVSLLASLATVVLTIGAIRTFVTDETERLPESHFTEDLVWPGLNFIVGAIVFGVIVGIGFVLLVVPGIFLLVTLVFWTAFVAVEGENFVEGMGSSWALTSGHRLRLFLLGVAVIVIEIVVSAVFGIGGLAGGFVGVVFAQAGSALTTVFSLATLAAAYTQLVGGADGPSDEREPVAEA